jgi:hypothetical protein
VIGAGVIPPPCVDSMSRPAVTVRDLLNFRKPAPLALRLLNAQHRVGDDESDDQLQAAILAYMREHPAAADTLDAIAEWWVMRRVVRVEVEAVARVLARLTDAGLVEVVESAGQQRYRLKMN